MPQGWRIWQLYFRRFGLSLLRAGPLQVRHICPIARGQPSDGAGRNRYGVPLCRMPPLQSPPPRLCPPCRPETRSGGRRDPAPRNTAPGKDAACRPAKAGEKRIGPSPAGIVRQPPHGVVGTGHPEAVQAQEVQVHDMTRADAKPDTRLRVPQGTVVQATMAFRKPKGRGRAGQPDRPGRQSEVGAGPPPALPPVRRAWGRGTVQPWRAHPRRSQAAALVIGGALPVMERFSSRATRG